jgi:hypothetical protein
MSPERWTTEKADAWYARQPWLVGCNFIPSTAINQLEMWQAETFDPQTITHELGWAAGLGFNAARVYLHDLPWLQDAAGFKRRIQQYLEIAAGQGIKTAFVLFDDCWHDHPRLGRQPTPRPGMHNSGWVKSPGSETVRNRTAWGRLEAYVQDILGTFGSDERVLLWDLYNEPGNNFLVALNQPKLLRALQLLSQLGAHRLLPIPSAPLLRAAFTWARATQPSQPLTAGLWYLREKLEGRLNPLLLELSDVITFHSYFPLPVTARLVTQLQATGRPLICSEYLARGSGCTFETHLPFFKEGKIGCFNWGLVSGKTQTMYSWEDYYPTGEEPPLWYHDILRKDGTPYKAEEAEFIRRTTGKR